MGPVLVGGGTMLLQSGFLWTVSQWGKQSIIALGLLPAPTQPTAQNGAPGSNRWWYNHLATVTPNYFQVPHFTLGTERAPLVTTVVIGRPQGGWGPPGECPALGPTNLGAGPECNICFIVDTALDSTKMGLFSPQCLAKAVLNLKLSRRASWYRVGECTCQGELVQIQGYLPSHLCKCFHFGKVDPNHCYMVQRFQCHPLHSRQLAHSTG